MFEHLTICAINIDGLRIDGYNLCSAYCLSGLTTHAKDKSYFLEASDTAWYDNVGHRFGLD